MPSPHNTHAVYDAVRERMLSSERAEFLHWIRVASELVGPRMSFLATQHLLVAADEFMEATFQFNLRSRTMSESRADYQREFLEQHAEDALPRWVGSYLEGWDALQDAAYTWEHPIGHENGYLQLALIRAIRSHAGALHDSGVAEREEEGQNAAVEALFRFVAQTQTPPWEWYRLDVVELVGLGPRRVRGVYPGYRFDDEE